jgi:hypothetical protein
VYTRQTVDDASFHGRRERSRNTKLNRTTFAFDGLSPGGGAVRQAALAVGRHGGGFLRCLTSLPWLVYFSESGGNEMDGALGSSERAKWRPAGWTIYIVMGETGGGRRTKTEWCSFFSSSFPCVWADGFFNFVF